MLRLDNTETDLMLVGDGQDVFVVLKRRENMKCVIRFVENGYRFIRCERVGRGTFDVWTDGNNGLYWNIYDVDKTPNCSKQASVVRRIGKSNQYVGAACDNDGIDIFFCTKLGGVKKPIMRLSRGGMFMYRSKGRSFNFRFDGLQGTASYYYGPFENREKCLRHGDKT